MTSAEKAKDRRLRDIYQMTLAEFNYMKEAQGNRCITCSRSFEEFTPYVDHDHRCCPRKKKKFCGKCNRGLACYLCNKFVIGAIERWEKWGIDIPAAFAYWDKFTKLAAARGIVYEPKKKTKKKSKA